MEVYEVKVIVDSPVMDKITYVEHRLLANSADDAINKVNEIIKNEDGFKVFTTLEVEKAILLSQEEQEKWFIINPEHRKETK